MAPQMHHVDNLGTRLANELKKIIHQERERIRFSYEHACASVENSVVNNFTIPAEDMAQRVFDYKKILWKDVYEPDLKECAKFMKMVNKLRDEPQRA